MTEEQYKANAINTYHLLKVTAEGLKKARRDWRPSLPVKKEKK